MATEASKFKIGLFVTLGLAIVVGAFIALGASRFFTDTRTYVSYFEESVQGLEPDSRVRYRGVPVGRVYKIRIAPDGRMVETVLKLDADLHIDPDMRIQMKYAGITGMKYLEIDREKPQEATPPKKLPFRPSARVIPSKPSDLEEILEGVGEVFDQIRAIDIEGISQKIQMSLDSLNRILGKKQWGRTVDNIEQTTASLRSASDRIDQMLDAPGVKDAFSHASDTLESLKQISARLKVDLEEAQLGTQIRTSAEKIDRFLDEGTRTLNEVRYMLGRQEDNISLILDNLRLAAESLNSLAASLRENPAQLFFAEPPAPKR